jgi:hypothetical protein
MDQSKSSKVRSSYSAIPELGLKTYTSRSVDRGGFQDLFLPSLFVLNSEEHASACLFACSLRKRFVC